MLYALPMPLTRSWEVVLRRTFVVVVVALAMAFALPAEAQFARSQLSGTVRDPDGAPLPGVTIVASNESNGSLRTVVSNLVGGYRFQGMTPGTYTITFSLNGFTTVEHPGMVLSTGQEPQLSITMVLGSIEETLTVTAVSPMVEVASKEVGGSLTSSEIENLPSINRSFVMFASLSYSGFRRYQRSGQTLPDIYCG